MSTTTSDTEVEEKNNLSQLLQYGQAFLGLLLPNAVQGV